jgi:hypothetical protein
MMPGWNILQYVFLLVLVLVIGIPLWLWEKITGQQPERLVNWLDEKLTR